MSTETGPDHVLVVSPDEEYSTRYPDHPPERIYTIECVRPDRCDGFQECPEDHPGDSEEGYYPDDDEQEFHGVLHPHSGWNWTGPYEGCVVQSADWETPDDLPRDAPYGRYDIDVEWGEPGDGPVLYLIAPTTPGRHTP